MEKTAAIAELESILGHLRAGRGPDGRSYDEERAGPDAESVLLAFVRGLGHNDLADAYDAVPRWYS